MIVERYLWKDIIYLQATNNRMIFRSGVMNGHGWMESGDLDIIVVCTLNQKSFWNSLFRSKMSACKEHILKGITFEVLRPWNGKTSERIKRGESKKASEREICDVYSGCFVKQLYLFTAVLSCFASHLNLFVQPSRSSRPLCLMYGQIGRSRLRLHHVS